MADGTSFGSYALFEKEAMIKKIKIEDKLNRIKTTLHRKGIREMAKLAPDSKLIEILKKKNLGENIEDDEKKFEKNEKEEMNKKKRTKRAATIQVVESGYFLVIDDKYFKTFILKSIKEDMSEKIRLLCLQPFFKVNINLRIEKI